MLPCSRNRFAPFKDTSIATSAFSKLAELQLNGTLMTWPEAEELILSIPNLRLVEMGYNRLKRLRPFPANTKSNIQVVNLDSNELDDWLHICETFQPYSTYVSLLCTRCEYEPSAQFGASYFVIKPNTEDSTYRSGFTSLAQPQTSSPILQCPSGLV
jgi:Leucine-rich repeat (LRR) protein